MPGDKWEQYAEKPSADKWEQYAEAPAQAAPQAGGASAAPVPHATIPSTDTISSYDPSIWERMRRAMPIIDRVQQGLSNVVTPSSNQAVMQKPLPGMSDQRAIAPEQMLTPTEQKQNPILTGAGEFAGGMTTPGNMLLQAGMGGPLPSMLSRGASALFSLSMLHGAAQEWPEFKNAIAQGKQTGDYSEAKRIGTHLIMGSTFGALVGKRAVSGDSMIPMYEQMTQDGRDVSRIQAQAKSKSGIQTSALGLYNSIAGTLQNHIALLTSDAVKAMEPVIAADKARGGAPINTAGVRANVEATSGANGYHPSPAEQNLLSQLGGQQVDPLVDQTSKNYFKKPYNQLDAQQQESLKRLLPPDLIPKNSQSMTIDKLLQLRTDIGNAAVRNKDATGSATMWSAYNAVGDLIRQSTTDIVGNTKPFDRYNNQLQAKFDLEKKGMTSDMLENSKKPFSVKADSGAVDKLKNFVDAEGDRDEIKNQMQQMGNKQGQKELDQHARDANSIVAANDAVEGKYLKSLSRLFMQHPTQSWPGIAVALATHGMLPFPASFLLPAAVSGVSMTLAAKSRAGKLGLRLRSQLPPEYFQGRPEVLGPEEQGPSTPPASTPPPVPSSPSSPAPSAAPTSTPSSPASVDTSNFPTAESRAASDRAFQMNYPKGVIPGKPMDPIAEKQWQKSAFGEGAGEDDTKDIGARARQANPEPTRKETKAEKIDKVKKAKSGR